ncbi:MAG: hypothetical protein JRH01_18255 [Deltaproteobacteria bacterium]|nr:hypothetical protein [Deltaproteobacteria bacterium]
MRELRALGRAIDYPAGSHGVDLKDLPVVELSVPLWILTHPDLEDYARGRRLLSVLGEELRSATDRQHSRSNTGL